MTCAEGGVEEEEGPRETEGVVGNETWEDLRTTERPVETERDPERRKNGGK